MAASVPGSRVVEVGRGARAARRSPRPAGTCAARTGRRWSSSPWPRGCTSAIGWNRCAPARSAPARSSAEAVRRGAARLVLAVGGSATTDGGSGLLQALGLRAVDSARRAVPAGGAGLLRLHRVEAGAAVPAPAGGVEVLVDVINPLLGRRGAAAVFAPAEGRGRRRRRDARARTRAVGRALGWRPAGAGGGRSRRHGVRRRDLVGRPAWCPGPTTSPTWSTSTRPSPAADVVITGEGRFDATSLGGKVVGAVLRRAAGSAAPRARRVRSGRRRRAGRRPGRRRRCWRWPTSPGRREARRWPTRGAGCTRRARTSPRRSAA